MCYWIASQIQNVLFDRFHVLSFRLISFKVPASSKLGSSKVLDTNFHTIKIAKFNVLVNDR